MKTLLRFFRVFWFQASASVWPVWIWVIIAFLGCAGSAKYYGDLGQAMHPFVLTTWVVVAAVMAIYLPEFFLPGSPVKNARNTPVGLFGLEFLATRAVSRSCIFRGRGLLFWGGLLAAVFCWIAWSAIHPSLTLFLPSYSGESARAGFYLDHIPGSLVEKISSDGDVTILMPMGNLQLTILLGATAVIVSSVWVYLVPMLARLPFRRGLFLAVVISGNLMMTIAMSRQREVEPFLLLGVQTLPYLIIAAAILALASQWRAGKRLAMLELM